MGARNIGVAVLLVMGTFALFISLYVGGIWVDEKGQGLVVVFKNPTFDKTWTYENKKNLQKIEADSLPDYATFINQHIFTIMAVRSQTDFWDVKIITGCCLLLALFLYYRVFVLLLMPHKKEISFTSLSRRR